MTDTLTALRADYEALGKRIAELEKQSCPLEEGKEVSIDDYKQAAEFVRFWSGRVSVEQNSYGSWCVTLKYPFNKEQCLKIARTLGGSSD